MVTITVMVDNAHPDTLAQTFYLRPVTDGYHHSDECRHSNSMETVLLLWCTHEACNMQGGELA